MKLQQLRLHPLEDKMATKALSGKKRDQGSTKNLEL